MAASSQVSIAIPGYTDVTGHTEYIIKTTIGEHNFAVQHRFSNFFEVRHECTHSQKARREQASDPPPNRE